MLLVAVSVLALVVAAGLAFTGLARLDPFARDQRGDAHVLGGGSRPWGSLVALAGAVVIGAAVLLAVLVLGVSGLRSSGDGGPARREQAVPQPRGTAVSEAPQHPTARGAVTEAHTSGVPDGAILDRPLLVLDAGRVGDRDFAPRPRTIGNLDFGDVLDISARGFPADSGGVVRQCTGVADDGACANSFPVRFDGDGSARFLYEVVDRPAGGSRCGAADGCTIELVSDDDPAVVARAGTVFGAPAPPAPRVRVAPVRDLRDGEVVDVDVTGLVPGQDIVVTLCVPPGTSAADCGDPASEQRARADASGRLVVAYEVRTGRVGEGERPCGRGAACGVGVLGPGVVAAPVPLHFAAPPGAAYDPARVAAGLAVALVLVAIAAWLVRRTDWTVPGEGDGHEIDEAELADLDAIVAALPPDPDDEDALTPA